MAETGPIGGSRPPVSPVAGSATPRPAEPTPPVEPVVPKTPDAPVEVPGRPSKLAETTLSDGFSGSDELTPGLTPAEPDGFAQAEPPSSSRPALLTPAPPRPREVTEVLPDLNRLEHPEQVPDRLVHDLAVVRHQLTEGKTVTRAEQAQRLVTFAAEYVERFVSLAPATGQAFGESKDHPGGQQGQGFARGQGLGGTGKPLFAQLEAALVKAGFHEVKELATGRTASELLKAAAQSGQPEAARHVASDLKFDAPTWPLHPNELAALATSRAELAAAQAAQGHAATPHDLEREARVAGAAQPGLSVDAATRRAQLGLMQVAEGRPLDGRPSAEAVLESQQSRKSRNGKLGTQMLWNFLHRLRGEDDGLTEDERREEMGRLAIAASVVVVALGVAMVALLSMS